MSETPVIRILLVDDQRMIGEVVRRQLLDQPDLSLRYCPDPAEAVACANEFLPHVILQDLVMPEVNGLELARLFRANPGTASTPIVLLSASDEAEVQHQAVEAGINGFLMKLPAKSELIASIRRYACCPP